jgi:DNA primase
MEALMKAPSFSAQEIAEAKARHDLAGLVMQRVQLKREGVNWKGLCPFHTEKTPSFTVTPARASYHCYGCGAHGDALSWLMHVHQVSFRQAVEMSLQRPVTRPLTQQRLIRTTVHNAGPAKPPNDYDAQRYLHRASQIWNEAVPATGTLVERYLYARGLIFEDKVPSVLRFHPDLLHEPTRQRLPAMIGAATDMNGKFTGIHRTYLAEDGSDQATVSEGGVKRMLASCFGSFIQLSEPQGNKLIIAEGIETALSLMQSCPDYGVWSAMTLGNLKAPVPRSVTEIVLATDSDNKDPRMAARVVREAADAHISRGHIVREAPAPAGKDFNDVLRGE